MRATVTGATGLIGRRLLSRLTEPVVLSRDATRAARKLARDDARFFSWDVEHAPPPCEAFDGMDVVFHLAGESVVSGRWTAAKKARIRDSRLLGTRNLVAALRQTARPPRALITASAVGYYGEQGEAIVDESTPPGDDFLASVASDWEREALAAVDGGIRVVTLRIGMVLSPDGGALAKMLTPFRLGLGSPLGSGRQWVAWIHIDDLVNLLLFAAERDDLEGPLSATAPNPVTNREFTKTLARAVHRPTWLPAVPKPILRLAIGDMTALLTTSTRAVPRRAEQAGYAFAHPILEDALRALLEPP